MSVTFTADCALNVRRSPPSYFEVLYLNDGIIVGGGPMLNLPGDTTPQAMPLKGDGF